MKTITTKQFSECLFLLDEHTPKNLKFIYEDVENLGKGFNAEDYVKKKFEAQGFKVIKCSELSKFAERGSLSFVLETSLREIGKPNFYVYDSLGFDFFVEVKTGADGLKGTQIKWIMKNPDRLVYVYYLNQINGGDVND